MSSTEGQDPKEAFPLASCRNWVIPASPTTLSVDGRSPRIEAASLRELFKNFWRFVCFVNCPSTDHGNAHTRVGSKEILFISELLNYKVLWVKCAE